jgi:hypothetical protein
MRDYAPWRRRIQVIGVPSIGRQATGTTTCESQWSAGERVAAKRSDLAWVSQPLGAGYTQACWEQAQGGYPPTFPCQGW